MAIVLMTSCTTQETNETTTYIGPSAEMLDLADQLNHSKFHRSYIEMATHCTYDSVYSIFKVNEKSLVGPTRVVPISNQRPVRGYSFYEDCGDVKIRISFDSTGKWVNYEAKIDQSTQLSWFVVSVSGRTFEGAFDNQFPYGNFFAYYPSGKLKVFVRFWHCIKPPCVLLGYAFQPDGTVVDSIWSGSIDRITQGLIEAIREDSIQPNPGSYPPFMKEWFH